MDVVCKIFRISNGGTRRKGRQNLNPDKSSLPVYIMSWHAHDESLTVVRTQICPWRAMCACISVYPCQCTLLQVYCNEAWHLVYQFQTLKVTLLVSNASSWIKYLLKLSLVWIYSSTLHSKPLDNWFPCCLPNWIDGAGQLTTADFLFRADMCWPSVWSDQANWSASDRLFVHALPNLDIIRSYIWSPSSWVAKLLMSEHRFPLGRVYSVWNLGLQAQPHGKEQRKSCTGAMRQHQDWFQTYKYNRSF